MELYCEKNESPASIVAKVDRALLALAKYVVRFDELEIGEKFLVLDDQGRMFPPLVYVKIKEWGNGGKSTALRLSIGISNVEAPVFSMITSDQLVLRVS